MPIAFRACHAPTRNPHLLARRLGISKSGGARSGGAESGGAESGGAESGGEKSGGEKSGGKKSGGARSWHGQRAGQTGLFPDTWMPSCHYFAASGPQCAFFGLPHPACHIRLPESRARSPERAFLVTCQCHGLPASPGRGTRQHRCHCHCLPKLTISTPPTRLRLAVREPCDSSFFVDAAVLLTKAAGPAHISRHGFDWIALSPSSFLSSRDLPVFMPQVAVSPNQSATQHHHQRHQPLPLSPNTIAALVAILAITLALLPALALFPPLRLLLSPHLPKPPPSLLRTMSTSTPIAGPLPLKITPRPWNARGHADHDWLYTFHTFSFASYHSATHESFGPLRVINEDRVAPGTGFGTHAHADFLIFSYIVAGALEHRDSMGNVETLARGDVQFTSAGSGIRHSEQNRDGGAEVHFLQIWARPRTRGLEPRYCTRRFGHGTKVDRLVRVVEDEGRGRRRDGEGEPILLDADLSMDASVLSPGRRVVHELVERGERKVYLHVVMRGREQPASGGAKIKVGQTVLGEGDGAYVQGLKGPGSVEVESVGDVPAEFLLFDMGL